MVSLRKVEGKRTISEAALCYLLLYTDQIPDQTQQLIMTLSLCQELSFCSDLGKLY